MQRLQRTLFEMYQTERNIMNIEFEIKGKVKAKQSVKFTNNGIKYTPSDIKEYANWVKLCFMNTYKTWDIQNFANKALKAIIDVYMPIVNKFYAESVK